MNTIDEWDDSSRKWRQLIRGRDWPLPHRRDGIFRILKVYVYANLTSIGRTIIRQTAEQTRPMYARRADCLVRFCDFGWGGHRGISDIRQFTADVPLLLRILQATTLVADPADADAFLVPVPIGTLQVSRWHMSAPGWRMSVPELRSTLSSSLSMLSTAPAKHIFLQTVDSTFIGMASKVGASRSAPLIPNQSIVVHLGDGLCMSGNVHKYRPTKRATCYPNSIVVPYRAFWPMAAAWSEQPLLHEANERRRPLLAFGSFGMKRHAYRGVLVKAVLAAEALAAGRLRVGALPEGVEQSRAQGRPSAKTEGGGSTAAMPTITATVDSALNSTFCLCPSGDTPALTQRFYASIFSGCIPVLIDLFDRYPNRSVPQALPFPSLIDWDRIVVRLPTRQPVNGEPPPVTASQSAPTPAQSHLQLLQREFDGLVPRLLALEPSAPARRRYMRRVAHWLRWDAPAGAEPDAASATLFEIARRLGKQPASLASRPRGAKDAWEDAATF